MLLEFMKERYGNMLNDRGRSVVGDPDALRDASCDYQTASELAIVHTHRLFEIEQKVGDFWGGSAYRAYLVADQRTETFGNVAEYVLRTQANALNRAADALQTARTKMAGVIKSYWGAVHNVEADASAWSPIPPLVVRQIGLDYLDEADTIREDLARALLDVATQLDGAANV